MPACGARYLYSNPTYQSVKTKIKTTMENHNQNADQLQSFEQQPAHQNQGIARVDPAAIAAAETAKQKIQAAYIMARANPRNVLQARQNILNACKRPRFAENAEYSRPQGNTKITGPTIRLAEHCLREWGNIDSDIAVVYDDVKIRRIKIVLTDLQTGSAFSKEVSISKTVERKNSQGRIVISERLNSYNEVVYVVQATDDELATKEAAMISKAIRNEGLRLIPSDIIEEALEIAAATRKSAINTDPTAHAEKMVESFAGIGVKVNQLEEYMKCAIDECSPLQIDELKQMYKSIKDGTTTWHKYTSSDTAVDVEKTEPEETKAKVTKSKAKGKAADKATPEAADSKGAKEKLEGLCFEAEINWSQVQKWAETKKLDISKDEDCAKVINAWATCKEFIVK